MAWPRHDGNRHRRLGRHRIELGAALERGIVADGTRRRDRNRRRAAVGEGEIGRRGAVGPVPQAIAQAARGDGPVAIGLELEAVGRREFGMVGQPLDQRSALNGRQRIDPRRAADAEAEVCDGFLREIGEGEGIGEALG